jgi:hypothetical protein
VARRQEAEGLVVATAGIWAAVAAISLLSPDLVSGSEQQHLPVAAFGTWLWGVGSTVMAASAWSALRRGGRAHLVRPLALGVVAVWALAALMAIFGPVVETGTDPTRLPIAALVAPVAATVATGVVRAAVEILDAWLGDPEPA